MFLRWIDCFCLGTAECLCKGPLVACYTSCFNSPCFQVSCCTALSGHSLWRQFSGREVNVCFSYPSWVSRICDTSQQKSTCVAIRTLPFSNGGRNGEGNYTYTTLHNTGFMSEAEPHCQYVIIRIIVMCFFLSFFLLHTMFIYICIHFNFISLKCFSADVWNVFYLIC